MELGNGVRTLYGYYGLQQANPWDAKPSAGLTAYGRLWTARTETLWGATVQDNRYAYDSVGNIAAWHTLPRSLVVTATANLTDTFTTISTTLWTVTGSVAISNSAALFSCSGSCTPPELVRKTNTITDAGSIQVRFRVNNTQAAVVLALESGTKQTSSYRRLAVYGHNGALWVQYNDGSSNGAAFREPTMLTSTLLANTWYTVTITTSNARGQTIELYKQGDNTAYDKHATYTIFLASGVNWRFHAWGPSVSGQTLTLDDYREFPTSQKFVPDEHQLYYYDELDRLVGVAKSFSDGYNASYTYDKIGNLITKTEPSAISYTYPAPGAARPHAATQAGSNSYTYNANGDMLTRTENNISYTQQWDKENRLQVVTNTTANPDIITTFFYNGDGARVKKTELKGAVITTTFYAGAIEVLSTTLLITKTYYSAGGQLVAIREVTNTTGAGTLTYLHSDHLGSTSTTTCGNSACGTVGAVLVRQSYYPYGGVRVAGNLPTDRTFTGQLEDDSTGLQFFNARYYSGSLGRFVSADTIVPGAGNPQKLNRYAFVLNNPLKYVDPTGHAEVSPGDGKYTKKKRYARVDGVGYFDLEHMTDRKYTQQERFWDTFEKGVNDGGDFTIELRHESGVKKMDNIHSLTMTYWVAGGLEPGSDKAKQVAMGIYQDFERLFEESQVLFSNFNVSDLPSDYLGLVAYMNGVEPETLLYQLGGEVQWLDSDPYDCNWSCNPQNTEFAPMIDDPTTGELYHTSWPAALQVEANTERGTAWGRSYHQVDWFRIFSTSYMNYVD